MLRVPLNTQFCFAGSFSCKYAEIYLSRDLGYYITRIFVPSFLIVGLSWVSFWIDYKSVPARISLGLLTVLTITTQASSISSRLPAVSYLKAVDIWMSMCLGFVFAGMVEYSVVNVLARENGKKKVSIIPFLILYSYSSPDFLFLYSYLFFFPASYLSSSSLSLLSFSVLTCPYSHLYHPL